MGISIDLMVEAKMKSKPFFVCMKNTANMAFLKCRT